MRLRTSLGVVTHLAPRRSTARRRCALALLALAGCLAFPTLAADAVAPEAETDPSTPVAWLRLAESTAPAAPAARWERARTIIAAGWIAVADLPAVREFSDRSGWTHLQRGGGITRRVPVPESRGEFSLEGVLVALGRLGRSDLAIDAALRLPRAHPAVFDTFGDPDEAEFSLLLARLAFELPAESSPPSRTLGPLQRLWEGSERARRETPDAASRARVGLDRVRLALEREQSFLAWEAATALAPESVSTPPALDPQRIADLVSAFAANGDAAAAERLALTLGSLEFRQRALVDAARAWAARQEPARARQLLVELPDDYPRRLGAGIPLVGLASVPIHLAERWSGVDWREHLVADPGLGAVRGVARPALPDVWLLVAAAVRHDSNALESGLKALPSDALRRRVTRLAKEEIARREMNLETAIGGFRSVGTERQAPTWGESDVHPRGDRDESRELVHAEAAATERSPSSAALGMNPGAAAEAARTTGDDPVPAVLKAAAEGDERPLRSLLEPGARATNRRHALRLRLLAAPETASYSRLAREVVDAETNPANRAELLAARALALLPRR